MSIGSIQASGSSMMEMAKPISPEEMAQQMVNAVDEGSVDAETLVANLTSRFGDDASTVMAEDGSIDVDELTSLLVNNAPGNGGETQGMAPPPPPPPPSQGMMSSEELQLQLTEEFGEEAVASIFEEDGTVNFDELISLVQSQDGSGTTTGILLNTSA
ncbi:hypothetical protein Q4488_04830 [Amphritea sp. 1_MG-2023]|uniref:hypothetical protein n=1 Tax=Amphritea sp. 1_MG-2023 TaxID=3062670 RepID=UPI0026E1DA08|nr:hypothetical protein [Amphritea sp. 1_MG-2023]MDO6562702.1 hypothetical protein [Amphritea sp. 1_MG-2023]